jgi:hypothetical protein
MIAEQQALAQLYKQVGQTPYKQSSSWTRTRTFQLDTQQRKQIAPFVVDERFVSSSQTRLSLAVPDSNAGTG